MGFPLHRGSVADGVLTCHWHHARFDLCTGGTFDQWADDAPPLPGRARGRRRLVDVPPPADPPAHQRERLRDGLERDIPLVLAKAAVALTRGRSRAASRRSAPGSTSASNAAAAAGSAG